MAMVSTGIFGSTFFLSIGSLLPDPPLRRSSDRISQIESSSGQNSISLLRSTHQEPPVMKPLRSAPFAPLPFAAVLTQPPLSAPARLPWNHPPTNDPA